MLQQQICSRDEVDFNLAVGEVEEAAHQGRPLYDERCDQQVEADTREPVPFQKRHQVPEPDEYHHVHVLEHWSYNMNCN